VNVLAVAVPFVWLGAVLAISFLEAPLKFRAPGITLPLGLGIGRLVFRALNVSELGLAVLLTVAVLVSQTPPASVTAALAGLWVLLLVQTTLLLPRLDRRTRLVLAGQTPPRSHLHLVYIALEVVKVILLPLLGVLLATG
jgi:hypothetical protein